MAIDREILADSPPIRAGGVPHNLARLMELLRGSHAEAADACRHVLMLYKRCVKRSPESILPVSQALLAAGALPLFAARMAAGGHGATRACFAIVHSLHTPAEIDAVVQTGAIPMMLRMVATLTNNPELETLRSVVIAAGELVNCYVI